jgi:alpha-galactosidase
VLSRQGSPPIKPADAAYGAEWIVGAEDASLAPAEIAAVVPGLKAMNIRWMTLGGRWFDAQGDWQPRGENLSGEALQTLVANLHKQGILAGLSWTPLAVEDAEAGKKGGGARVAREHPEWLVLDGNGRHARTTHNLAALCPAVPEVREYIRQQVTRFLQHWDFDGLRLEDVYTVPECHNPAHHHQSPQDSLRAMAEAYKQILLTARKLRPQSVVAVCPCGTTPNHAWLPYVDKPVSTAAGRTAQARHWIKMYKALLGPQAAVSATIQAGQQGQQAASSREDLGGDFASTIGLGAVPGVRWGRTGGGRLAPAEKEADCRRWLKIYSELMLSQGDFQNFYTTGFDDPEGYVIQQNGKTYFAFFTAQPDKAWKGELDLRGLTRGRFRVYDYANGKELGTVTSPRLRVAAQFTGYLLLEVSPLK